MNYAMKKRVNSPPRAIDHPEDLKSVYTTSGKGARRSREYTSLALSQCGSAFGVCELTVAYHHLSQYLGVLGISSRSEEPHHGQLSLSLPLLAFEYTFCTSWALWSLGWPGQRGENGHLGGTQGGA